MNQQFYKNKKAFTLIETLLYISLTSIILISISAFMGALISTNQRNKAISEVDQQATQILQVITESIKSANGINTPVQAGSGSSLSLSMANSAVNPIVISLSNNILQIQEGSVSTINLSSTSVIVNNITFYNMSTDASNLAIRFEFTMSYNNTSGRKDSDLTKTYYGAATIK
ncbi:hypothetical protein KC678_03030 [Candidatus Dojkabacteria bacterium]|uniref:Type II secretion system protein n=1 Tax=Candidatus Dojkabacteria bacterium TaxID=2099670 RepID=A0A955L1P5_9BACT|nr:hypothetical protein [Candidatus Dojkabacteria bacterium]